jgi:hypothetical protein
MPNDIKLTWDWQGYNSGYHQIMRDPEVIKYLVANAEKARSIAQKALTGSTSGDDFIVLQDILPSGLPRATVMCNSAAAWAEERRTRVLSRAIAEVLD